MLPNSPPPLLYCPPSQEYLKSDEDRAGTDSKSQDGNDQAHDQVRVEDLPLGYGKGETKRRG